MNQVKDELKKEVINIAEISHKLVKSGKMAKIKDARGLTFNVFEKKQDGNTTKAWEQMAQLDIGSDVQVSYAENQYTAEDGSARTSRSIRFFDFDIGNGVANHRSQQNTSNVSTPVKTPHSEANTGQYGESREAFGKRLAIHGFTNSILASGVSPENINDGLIIHLLALEDRLEKHLNPSLLRQAVQKAAPQVQVSPDIQEMADVMKNESSYGSDVNVDDLPF